MRSRKHNTRSAHASEDMELSMTPMIDVVFQLLIYFLVDAPVARVSLLYCAKIYTNLHCSASPASDASPIVFSRSPVKSLGGNPYRSSRRPPWPLLDSDWTKTYKIFTESFLRNRIGIEDQTNFWFQYKMQGKQDLLPNHDHDENSYMDYICIYEKCYLSKQLAKCDCFKP